MKIALPIWNNRISPLFDTACMVLIWSVDGEGVGEREEHDLRGLHPQVRVRRIKELGADILICGAVSNPVAYLVERADIKLIPWVSGPVDEVIKAFRSGQLDRSRYFMPGCGRMRGRRGQPGTRRRRGGRWDPPGAGEPKREER